MAKRTTRRTRPRKMGIKKLILGAILGIMSALGVSSYFYDLKPLFEMGAEYVESLFTTPLNGNVLQVTDGDTLSMVDADGNELKVRLYGIDAPESSQRYGDESRQALEDMIYGKDIQLTIINTDQYGRDVGILEFEGNNINEQMLADGYAWYYDAYCTKSFCLKWEQLANLARIQKKNLWQQPNPTPPWEYRRK